MAYFRIEKTGCSERKGLLQIRFDLYLEPGDFGYELQQVKQPIIPAAGYPGKKNKDGTPADIKAFITWMEGLPQEIINTPFVHHFIQFDPAVTNEEILYCGELALDAQYRNWQNSDLTKNVNLPVKFDASKKAATTAKLAEVLATDFTKITLESTVPYSVRE